MTSSVRQGFDGAKLLFLRVCLGGLLVAISLWALTQEAGVLGFSQLSEAARLSALRSAPPPVGLSTLAHGSVLDSCLQGVTSVAARLMAPSDRIAIAKSCQVASETISSTEPSNGYAMVVSAEVRAVQQDGVGFKRELLASQRVTPNEQWLGELRVRLVGEYPQFIDGDIIEAEAKDLRMLVASQRGIFSIASRYVTDPKFRGRVLGVVQQMPPTDQQRFIDQVKRAAARLGILVS